MKIYTSYFAKIIKLPNNILPISIALKNPSTVDIISFKALAPSWNILNQYKNNHDIELYTKQYNSEILSKLNPDSIVNQLEKMSNGNDVALICYEKSSNFCHRHLVAKWLTDNGYPTSEWK